MTIYLKNKHTLEIDDFKFRCSIGKKGKSKKKKKRGIEKLQLVIMQLKIYTTDQIELKNRLPI